MDVLKLLTFSHILPAVAGSALSLLLVLFMLTIFRIRRASVRHTFLMIPLVKPLFLLVGGVDIPKRLGRFSVQIPDPLNLVPSHFDSYAKPGGGYFMPEKTDLFIILLVIVALMAVLHITIRWASIVRYRSNIARSNSINLDEYKEIAVIAERLSADAGVQTPKLVFADSPSPFLVGTRNFTIAIPYGLIEELAAEEIEAILAHEIAHIKRKDNLWLWFALMCKDIMFFNPVAWLNFKLLSTERELAADHRAARLTKNPVSLARSLVKIAETMAASTYTEPPTVIVKTTFAPKSSLERRVNALLGFRTYRWAAFKAIPLGLLFLILFYVRYFFNIQITDNFTFSFFF